MIRTMTAATFILTLASPAAAQDVQPNTSPAPIVTHAPAATAAPALSASATAPTADSTDRQISAWIGDDGDTATGSVPGVVSAMPARRDRAVHGEVGASIGSGGYRSAYGVVNMPIGENSDVTIAIADQHLGGGNRLRGYGGGYGYRGGDRQSLGTALNLNGVGRGAPATDCEAAPKWSLGLPDDAALSNRCRRMQHGGIDASQR